MLTSIDVKFIFDSAYWSASLGDTALSKRNENEIRRNQRIWAIKLRSFVSELFSSANILEIADVVRSVVFLMFFLCF